LTRTSGAQGREPKEFCTAPITVVVACDTCAKEGPFGDIVGNPDLCNGNGPPHIPVHVSGDLGDSAALAIDGPGGYHLDATMDHAGDSCMREAPAGRIVNVSSRVGSLATIADPAYPYRSILGLAYSPSKTALNAVTVAFALELADTPIKVNAACPGYTATDLNGHSGPRTVATGHMNGRSGFPQNAARTPMRPLRARVLDAGGGSMVRAEARTTTSSGDSSPNTWSGARAKSACNPIGMRTPASL
jgi:hypothetical protein